MKVYVKRKTRGEFELMDLHAQTVGDVRRELKISNHADAYLNWKRAPEGMRLINYDTVIFLENDLDAKTEKRRS